MANDNQAGGRTFLAIVLGGIVLALVIAAYFMYGHKAEAPAPAPEPPKAEAPAPAPAPEPTPLRRLLRRQRLSLLRPRHQRLKPRRQHRRQRPRRTGT